MSDAIHAQTPGATGDTRTETDSMGAIEVPAGNYWAAQTQRSLYYFAVGRDTMPQAVDSSAIVCASG